MTLIRKLTTPVIAVAVLYCMCVATTNNLVSPQSSGAPASSTGAPGEQTCASIGCHDDGIVNAGPAFMQIQRSHDLISYASGERVSMTVRLSDSSCRRFGFQIVALDGRGRNAGRIELRDLKNTQLIQNLNELQDRQYCTYTFAGTSPSSAGVGQWSFDWIAPDSGVGTVTFYAATVAANDDATDAGDKVYLKSMTLKLWDTDVASGETSDIDLHVFPDPVQSLLVVKSASETSSNAKVSLFDFRGNLIINSSLRDGSTVIDCSMYSAGSYMLRLETDGRYEYRTFQKQ